MKPHDLNFVLQFAPSEIDALIDRYGSVQDRKALHAGELIASGDYSRDNLRVIVDWSAPSRAGACDLVLGRAF